MKSSSKLVVGNSSNESFFWEITDSVSIFSVFNEIAHAFLGLS